MFELETAKARFEHKMRKMDRKITHQGQSMDRLCQERIRAEATACLHRIDKRAMEERTAWAEENDVRLELVKDDLRGWVEGKLKDVQRQIKMLDQNGEGGKLRVRSKSESDLGTIDSMEETTVDDDTDMEGIVIGRRRSDSAVKEADGCEEEMDDDEEERDEADGNDNNNETVSVHQESPLHRRKPVMRGRNVRTGKYGKPLVTVGRSRSVDGRLTARPASSCDARYDAEHDSSDYDDHSDDEREEVVSHGKHVEFSIPTYGSVSTDETKSKGQETVTDSSGSDRSRSSKRMATQGKRTSSFTRAVQSEMRAAANSAAANNDSSDGSVRAMVEGTYRPPIVVVSDPHRMGSYSSSAADGIQPANLSSAAESDSDETLSVSSSEDSLVTVSRLTLDSPAMLTPHSVQQQDSRQPASGQSESSPSASHSSSSPGDAVAAASAHNSKPHSICSKSSSGISSGASTSYSIDDMVSRASSISSSSTLNRWSLARGRPSSSRDVPPPSAGAYGSASQHYVTSKSAYAAQQNQQVLNNQSQPGNNTSGLDAVNGASNPYAVPGHTYARGQHQLPSQPQTTGLSGTAQPRQTAAERLLHHPSNPQNMTLSGNIPLRESIFKSQQSMSQSGPTQPRQTAIVQPPAFRSSKLSQPLAGGSAFAARSLQPARSESLSHSVNRTENASPHQHGPQQQQKQTQQQQVYQKHHQQQQLPPPSYQRHNPSPLSHQSDGYTSIPASQSYHGQLQHGLSSQVPAPVRQVPSPSSLQIPDVASHRPVITTSQDQQPSGHAASHLQDGTLTVSRSGQLLLYHQISTSSNNSNSQPSAKPSPTTGQSVVVPPPPSRVEISKAVQPANTARPAAQQMQPRTAQSMPSRQITSPIPVGTQPQSIDNASNARPVPQSRMHTPHTSVPSQATMPTRSVPTASAAGRGRPPVPEARPRTTHRLPSQAAVPSSSVSQQPYLANSQSRMPDTSIRSGQSASASDSSSSTATTATSGSQRSVIRRTTYEISL